MVFREDEELLAARGSTSIWYMVSGILYLVFYIPDTSYQILDTLITAITGLPAGVYSFIDVGRL